MAASCTYHLSSPCCSTRDIQKSKEKKKAHVFMKNIGEFSGEKSQDHMDHKQKSDKTGRATRPIRTRQVIVNGSPEIPVKWSSIRSVWMLLAKCSEGISHNHTAHIKKCPDSIMGKWQRPQAFLIYSYVISMAIGITISTHLLPFAVNDLVN